MTPEKFNHRIPEAADLLGIGRTTLYLLIKEGEIRTVKIGERTLVPHSELVEFQQRLLQQPDRCAA